MLFAGQFHSNRIWFNTPMTKISQIVTKNAGASALLGGGAPVVSLSGNPAIYYVNIDATSGDLLEITLR